MLGLLAGGTATLLSGCGGSSTIRYRLTLEVETPEGKKTGSGVIEQVSRYNDGITRGLGAGPGLAVRLRGEAIIVDLGSRGLLLCLLTRDESRYTSEDDLLLPKIFPFAKWGGSQEDYSTYLRQLESRKPVADAPLERLPMLARLSNPQDPATAERVNPTDLAATFGAGVRLVRVTAQITDDPLPAPTIEDKLPWVRKLQGSIAKMLGLKRNHFDVLNQINDGSFRQGQRQ
jgi:hypothetical protein